MELYEYLIGGKKTGQIDDLKDIMPDSKPFRELKTGDSFFTSNFKLDGTCVYADADEIKISSIDKEPTYWVFTGFTKKGRKCHHPVLTEYLDKKLAAWDQRTRYMVLSTFKMDAESLFELAKKEIKNSKK